MEIYNPTITKDLEALQELLQPLIAELVQVKAERDWLAAHFSRSDEQKQKLLKMAHDALICTE